ncbi:MAG TPA: hypothetical protein VLH60_05915, partial [Sedimentisphaerales bacterium]|nr:hypothetical protein [Sedimentisphaerales bacterium]
MAEFQYEAIDSSGAAVTGRLDAPNRRSAIETMAVKSLFVTSLREGSGRQQTAELRKQESGNRTEAKATEAEPGLFGRRTGTVTHRDVLAMTAQLATALKAGLPVLTAIEILAR